MLEQQQAEGGDQRQRDVAGVGEQETDQETEEDLMKLFATCCY